jgi:DNA processing protein
MDGSSQLPYWLAALHLPNIGPRTILNWLQVFPDIQSIFTASSAEYTEKGIPIRHQHNLQNINWGLIENELKWSEQNHHHLISLDDAYYPPLLKEIHDPPLVLFVKGNKAILSEPQLAMVGSRYATTTGIKHATQFSSALAEEGWVITSGLAKGIDAASHRGALSVEGFTIAVSGTGLNYIYPPAHQSLADSIIQQQGAMISEFPLATRPQPIYFPRRNRIISGLSLGVLVIEAALKSGSLITARLALEQGREVFAVPGPIYHPLARGCHHLIRQGAKLVETMTDIVEELGRLSSNTKKIPAITRKSIPLSVQELQLLEQIDYEITSLDVILLRARLTAAEVSSMLLQLELSGYVQSVPGGYTRIIPDDH